METIIIKLLNGPLDGQEIYVDNTFPGYPCTFIRFAGISGRYIHTDDTYLEYQYQE